MRKIKRVKYWLALKEIDKRRNKEGNKWKIRRRKDEEKWKVNLSS